jgi:hypothetical protein
MWKHIFIEFWGNYSCAPSQYTSLVEIPSNSNKFAKICFIVIQVLEFVMVHNYNFPKTQYWEYVIECVFPVEGHIILKIWLILRI